MKPYYTRRELLLDAGRDRPVGRDDSGMLAIQVVHFEDELGAARDGAVFRGHLLRRSRTAYSGRPSDDLGIPGAPVGFQLEAKHACVEVDERIDVGGKDLHS